MSINFKPINEVPEITELAEGDKLLVNSGGTAKQIDASKVGGKGGGGSAPIYAVMVGGDDESGAFGLLSYADADHTQMLTYDQGVEMLLGVCTVVVDAEMAGVPSMIAIPVGSVPDPETRSIQIVIAVGESMGQAILAFSDTAM